MIIVEWTMVGSCFFIVFNPFFYQVSCFLEPFNKCTSPLHHWKESLETWTSSCSWAWNLSDVSVQENRHIFWETSPSTRSAQVHRFWYNKGCEWDHTIIHHRFPFFPNLDDTLGFLKAICVFGFEMVFPRAVWDSNLTYTCRCEEMCYEMLALDLESVAVCMRGSERDKGSVMLQETVFCRLLESSLIVIWGSGDIPGDTPLYSWPGNPPASSTVVSEEPVCKITTHLAFVWISPPLSPCRENSRTFRMSMRPSV